MNTKKNILLSRKSLSSLSLMMLFASPAAVLAQLDNSSIPNNIACSIFTISQNQPKKNETISNKIIDIKESIAIQNNGSCLNYVKKYYSKEANCGLIDPNTKIIARLRDTSKANSISLVINTDSNSMDSSNTEGLIKCSSDSVAKSAPNACADKNFCVHSNMPILNQGAPGLATEISKLTGDSTIKKDAGWCAAVSSTMAYAAKSGDGEIQNLLYADLPGLLSVPKKEELNERTAAYSKHIYDIGNLIKVNWKKGGAYMSDLMIANKQRYLNMDVSPSVSGKRVSRVAINNSHVIKNVMTQFQDNNYYIDLFKNEKPELVIGVYALTGYYKKDGTVDTKTLNYKIDNYSVTLGHALALNGIEDGHIKIFDPWGRIYNIDIKKSDFFEGKQVLSLVGSKPTGFIKNEYKSGPVGDYAYLHSYQVIDSVTGNGARLIDAKCHAMIGGNLHRDEEASCSDSVSTKKYLQTMFCSNRKQLNWTQRLYTIDGTKRTDYQSLSDLCSAFGLDYFGKK